MATTIELPGRLEQGMPRTRTLADVNAETVVADRLAAFLAEEKSLSAPVVWRSESSRKLSFTLPIEVDGVTLSGLTVFGRANASVRDRDVTLGLAWTDPDARGGNFDRLDWRPLGAHNNQNWGPPEHRLVLIEGTHHHRLEENAALPMGLLQAVRENLPVALPVEPEPFGWGEFCALAAERWKVHDISAIPEPPWQYDLPFRRGDNE